MIINYQYKTAFCLLMSCLFMLCSLAQNHSKVKSWAQEVKPGYTTGVGYIPEEEFKIVQPDGLSIRFRPDVDQEYYFKRTTSLSEDERKAKMFELYGDESVNQFLKAISFWLLPILTIGLMGVYVTTKQTPTIKSSIDQLMATNKMVPVLAIGSIALYIVFGLSSGNSADFKLLLERTWLIALSYILGLSVSAYLFQYLLQSIGAIQQVQRIILLIGLAFGCFFLTKYINDIQSAPAGDFFHFESHLLNWVSAGTMILLSAYILLQKPEVQKLSNTESLPTT